MHDTPALEGCGERFKFHMIVGEWTRWAYARTPKGPGVLVEQRPYLASLLFVNDLLDDAGLWQFMDFLLHGISSLGG